MNDFYSNNPRPGPSPSSRYGGYLAVPNTTDRPMDPGQWQPRRPTLWLRLTSAVEYLPQQTMEQREEVRRNRLASWIILGMFVVVILLIPVGIGSPSTAAAIAIAFIGLIICATFNHAGWTTAAGVFLVILINAGIVGALAGASGGLQVVDLPAFDLLAISVVVGATILPRTAAFIIATCNCILIVATFLLLPEAPDLMHQVAALGTISLLARPIALQILLAIVAYLWVRGVDEQVRRADRAEEVAALEHAYAAQRQQLEVGVQQILQTHVRIANGDYSARAPLTQDNVLWQIAVSLNNLVTRLRTSNHEAGQAAYELARQNDEIQRLAAALRDLQANRRPVWPAPTGTAVDQLILILSGRSRPQQYSLGPAPYTRPVPPYQSGPSSFGGPPGSGPLGGPPTRTPTPPPPGQSSVPPVPQFWSPFAQPGQQQTPTWPPTPDTFSRGPSYSQPVSHPTGELGRMPNLGDTPSIRAGLDHNMADTPSTGAGLDHNTGSGFGAASDPGTNPVSSGASDPGIGFNSLEAQLVQVPEAAEAAPAPTPREGESVPSTTPNDDEWPSLQAVELGPSPETEVPVQSDGASPPSDNP